MVTGFSARVDASMSDRLWNFCNIWSGLEVENTWFHYRLDEMMEKALNEIKEVRTDE